MAYQLRRNAKILTANGYNAVFRAGSWADGKYWQVVAKPNDTDETKQIPQLGLAIAKKKCRLAVHRNRFKRIARETFRLEQKRLKNWGFVVMIKTQKTTIKAVKGSVLSAELLSLLQKVTQH